MLVGVSEGLKDKDAVSKHLMYFFQLSPALKFHFVTGHLCLINTKASGILQICFRGR